MDETKKPTMEELTEWLVALEFRVTKLDRLTEASRHPDA